MGGRGAPEGRAVALSKGCGGGGVLEGCAGGAPRSETPACPGRPPLWAEGCTGGVCHSPAEGACRRGRRRGRRCWEPPHALGGLLCGRRGAPEGCAIALPRGCARGVSLLGAAACPGRPPLWAEGRAGGVCHSPAEGALRRGRTGGEPPHALGGLLCGRRGAPEGCAIALPRECARGGVAILSRHMPWEASYVGGGVRRKCVP